MHFFSGFQSACKALGFGLYRHKIVFQFLLFHVNWIFGVFLRSKEARIPQYMWIRSALSKKVFPTFFRIISERTWIYSNTVNLPDSPPTHQCSNSHFSPHRPYKIISLCTATLTCPSTLGHNLFHMLRFWWREEFALKSTVPFGLCRLQTFFGEKEQREEIVLKANGTLSAKPFAIDGFVGIYLKRRLPNPQQVISALKIKTKLCFV